MSRCSACRETEFLNSKIKHLEEAIAQLVEIVAHTNNKVAYLEQKDKDIHTLFRP